MAQLTRGTGNSAPKLVSPPGYEVVDKAVATEVIAAGQLVKLGASGLSLTAAGATDADGVAAKNCVAGEEACEYIIHGEIDNYGDALTPGAYLYPSASVAGGIQTDTVASTTLRMKVVTATRIRVCFT